ncbi:MAG: FAD:protein transferase [Patescibacteria group bacterium]|nr:FAD:protein transferase [Patescibacteria group bacterium]
MQVRSNYILNNFEALGTKWYIEYFDILEENKKLEIEEYIKVYIKDFEQKYSRFLPDSILNKYNRGEIALKEDKTLEEIINLALEYNTLTEGVFDINIKDRLEGIGYGKLSNNNIHNVDLGGIGKGYLIDKVSMILQDRFNIKYFLINGGGDIYVTSDNGKEVEVLLQHPIENDKYIKSIRIKNLSLCCSSSFKRFWVKDGEEHNHFIDIGSVDKKVSAASYVLADSALKADIYATVLCILSNQKDKLNKIMNKDKDVKYLVLDHEANIINNDIILKI